DVQRVWRAASARPGRSLPRARQAAPPHGRGGACGAGVRVRAAAGPRALEFSFSCRAAGSARAGPRAGRARVADHCDVWVCESARRRAAAIRARRALCACLFRAVGDREHRARDAKPARDRLGASGVGVKAWIAAALVIEMVVIAALWTIALDLLAHKRVERLGGVNLWGYRGPVMPHRRPNEIRIAVVGGDVAFGWGVAASETLAPTVRQL